MYKCKGCDGHGEVDSGWYAPIIEKCPVCKGKGKVDWITNIYWRSILKQSNEESGKLL